MISMFIKLSLALNWKQISIPYVWPLLRGRWASRGVEAGVQGLWMWAPPTLDTHGIFQVTGSCLPEWLLNFLFQTSVISSRVYRVHDTNTSGFGGMDLRYLQANMSGADVVLAARDDGGDLSGSPIWGFAWSNTALPADFSCVSNLGAWSPAQRDLVAFSLGIRGTQNIGIAAFHAEKCQEGGKESRVTS